MQQQNIRNTAQKIVKKRCNDLEAILIRHCGERGDSEGSIETLERIIRERDILLRNGIKSELLKLK